MSNSQSLGLMAVLTYFLLINLTVLFDPPISDQSYLRPMALFFSIVLIVDIVLILRDFHRGQR